MFPYAPEFTLLLCASIVFDIVVAIALLAFPLGKIGPIDWNTRITLPRCLFAAAIVTMLWVPKVLVSRFLGVYMFGYMSMAWFTAAVAAPAIGILTLAIPFFRGRMTPGVKAFAAASLVAIPTALYASYFEPGRIVFEESTVPVAGVKDPIRIAVLADIQCSRITTRDRRIAAHVNAMNPDLILIPGDLWQERGSLGSEELDLAGPVAQEFRDFLKSLHAPGGVYFSPGNAEEMYGWRALLDGTGVEILENNIARIRIRDQDVALAGTELNTDSDSTQRTISDLESTPEDGSLVILMSHMPDVIMDLAAYHARCVKSRDWFDGGDAYGKPVNPRDNLRTLSRTDLVVCGHTHGGQVCIPGVGPLITFSDVPSNIAAGGLHALDPDTWLYVSRGVGMERGQAPRIRFLCPPEVSVLTIQDPTPSHP